MQTDPKMALECAMLQFNAVLLEINSSPELATKLTGRTVDVWAHLFMNERGEIYCARIDLKPQGAALVFQQAAMRMTGQREKWRATGARLVPAWFADARAQ